MKKLPTLILFFLFCSSVLLMGYEPGRFSRVEVSLLPNVTFSPSTGLFVYGYSTISSSQSFQEVHVIKVMISESISSQTAPKGWEISRGSRNPDLPPMAGWFASWGDLPEGNVVPDHDNVDPSPYNIKPGNSLSGFSFESKSPPGVVEFLAGGFARLLTTEEEPESSFPPGHSVFDDFFKGKTIGPVAVTDSSADGLIDRLISLKDSMSGYGWITNQGIINSLNVKLNAAKESIAKGNNKTASNQLNAFINELEAQKGKQVNENAWALLKANAEFLINKLAE